MIVSDSQTDLLWRVTVAPRPEVVDAHGQAIQHEIRELGLQGVHAVSSSRLYLLQGLLDGDRVERIARELLADPVTETFNIDSGGDDLSLPGRGFDAAIEVRLKGGVMDTVAGSTLAAIADMGIDTADLAVATARLYRLQGVDSIEQADTIASGILANDCIEEHYLSGFGRHDPRPKRLPVAPVRPFELRHVAIRELDDDALTALSRQAHLFLSVEEMRTIQAHYRELGREPTDLELEMLAQTWSEHCVHKTLRSAVTYEGAPFPAFSAARQERIDEHHVQVRYENLLKDTIVQATRHLNDTGRVDWCLSVFEDNAGVIVFDDRFGVAFKVETHNHPSAIEPYGGAATGVGGCIRDILGCGLGAKPIANTDVFCFAPPDFPASLLPRGVLHPRRVYRGVVGGVRDYGNRMGIPTVNGAIVFDDRYLGNPLVFCGCVGLIPRDSIHKQPRPGDLIVVIGGRTGRDGIHGATFSSAELTDTHANEFSHAVQIGDAITEKKVLDALMQARDHQGGCLHTAVTDCGAGGLSSAVGEMAATLGADVELAHVPLKYAGLRYDEIWISEAQERMVLAVPSHNWPALESICRAENVEATVIGTFRDDGQLVIRYEDKVVGEIDTHFLHEGLHRSDRRAGWSSKEPWASVRADDGTHSKRASGLISGSATDTFRAVWPPGSRYRDELMFRLGRLDTASKEWVIRQYDHEVQGASVVKPLVGPGQGPSDGAVLRPRLDSDRGIAIACGIAPHLADDDPYWMAIAAIDEAVRNIVCVGGDPGRTAILDNFCWGNCQDPQVFGALVRACQGCYDAAVAYGTPFISGKDSLNNEFALDPADVSQLAGRIPLVNNRIRIPSTLLISAVSIIEDVHRCVTMDAKDASSVFFFAGMLRSHWREIDPADAAALHRAVASLIASGAVLAAHDCGEDGMVVALAEMALAGQCGISIDVPTEIDIFAPIPCGYILQLDRAQADTARHLADANGGISARQIGAGHHEPIFKVRMGDRGQFEASIPSLAEAWRASLRD